jgi:hydroxyethylthiazole kinase
MNHFHKLVEEILEAISLLRQTKPLVLCLTNYVTMDFMANCLLSIGAAPIMSQDIRELDELISKSKAVNLNIGTLDDGLIQRAKMAVEVAKKLGKPIVIDPVGAGATKLRTNTARDLILSSSDESSSVVLLQPTKYIVRGNASEILALCGVEERTAGVETTHKVMDAVESAKQLAIRQKCVVVISGPQDFITDGVNHELLDVGSFMMPLIVGMGCTLTAVIAAFCAVVPDPFKASVLATAFFGICGSIAVQNGNKPGSFHTAFIDALYNADFHQLTLHIKRYA